MTIKQLCRRTGFLILLISLFSIKPLQAQVYPDIVRALFTTTTVNGIKIKTNIPFAYAADMVSLEIKGYSYGKSAPLDLHLCFYLFSNASGVYFHIPSISSSGAYTPKILLANEDGKVIIFIDDKVSHQKLYINAFSGLNKPTYYTGWTIVDEPLTGSNTVEPIYKNSFKGEITLPGGKWTSAGNVGIGTDVPKEKLSVNGNIRAHQIKVETANWPDYVFEEDYDLPSLNTTAEFIKANKHLPGVPTAKEVEEDGVSVGEMNKILLQKIEELTLHLIEKDKQAKNHESEINKLKEKIERIEQKITN
ncbi:hypothetical protein GEO21_18955 [Sphingobacterium faecium]|uniref:hypothetical protein n=1 Tax=Sphingobacterium faecium TaxID=34087 RepID=UPI0012923D3B|nr:hypothetical protein [Sphingobacterium faecium]MQP29573.1 hypothetical protein [Sphingobacterium faecium]